MKKAALNSSGSNGDSHDNNTISRKSNIFSEFRSVVASGLQLLDLPRP